MARASPDIPSKFLQCQEISRRLGALGTQICPDNGGSAVQKRPLPKVTRSVRGVKLPSSMAVALGGPGLASRAYYVSSHIYIYIIIYICIYELYIYIILGTGVTFAPERGSHSPLNQKGPHSPLNHKTFNVVLNPLGLNLGTRGHLRGLGNL